MGIKWRNWKMMFKSLEDGKGTGAIITHGFPQFFNLYNDPKEMYPLTKATAGHFWVRWPMGTLLTEHMGSFEKEPQIKAGTPDPYVPAKK
jgi:arylsulfatase